MKSKYEKVKKSLDEAKEDNETKAKELKNIKEQIAKSKKKWKLLVFENTFLLFYFYLYKHII